MQFTVMAVPFLGVTQVLDTAVFVDHHTKWKEKLQIFTHIVSYLSFLTFLTFRSLHSVKS